MGVDIHMSLIRDDGKVLMKDVYDGRNSEWFNNLQDRGWDDEYSKLPYASGIPEFAPEFIKKDYAQEPGYGYYGFAHMNYQDYADWYAKYKPQLSAGWMSTYDKWRMENKAYVPEDVLHYIPEDANPADLHFVEFVNPYDPNTYVIERVDAYLAKHDEDNKHQVYLVYYFDC